MGANCGPDWEAQCHMFREEALRLRAELDAAQQRIAQLEAERDAQRWEDGPSPEDEAIMAAHPLRSGCHALHAQAMELVGARHSKGSLVALVNWLLHRVDAHPATPDNEKVVSAEREAEIRHEVGQREGYFPAACRDLLTIIDALRAELANVKAERDEARANWGKAYDISILAIEDRDRLLTERSTLDAHELAAAHARKIAAAARTEGVTQGQESAICLLETQPDVALREAGAWLRRELGKGVTARWDEVARMRDALAKILSRNPQGAELEDGDEPDVCPECDRRMDLRPEADRHSLNVCDSCIHDIASEMEEFARKALRSHLPAAPGLRENREGLETDYPACPDCTWADGRRVSACARHRGSP